MGFSSGISLDTMRISELNLVALNVCVDEEAWTAEV